MKQNFDLASVICGVTIVSRFSKNLIDFLKKSIRIILDCYTYDKRENYIKKKNTKQVSLIGADIEQGCINIEFILENVQ